MVTRKFIKSFFLFFIFSCFIFTSKVAYADDNTLIEKYNMLINVNADGSISITEIFNMSFDGSFNGGFKDISTRKTDGIKNLKVFLVENGEEKEFFYKSDAQKKETGVYNSEEIKDDFSRVKVFIPSKNITRTFKFTYDLVNVATLYNDTGEVYFNIWDKGYDTQVNNFTVTFKLPKEVNKNEVKFFSRGVPSINSLALSNDSNMTSTIIYKGDKIETTNYLSIRVLFPRNIIQKSGKIVNEDKINSIITDEEHYIMEQESKALKSEKFNSILSKSIFLILAINLLLILKFLSLNKRNIDNSLLSLVPSPCSPAVMSYFYNGMVSSKDFVATILNLNKYGYIGLDKVSGEKKDDFIITINSVDGSLKGHERKLLLWLKSFLKDDNTLSLNNLEKLLKKDYNAATKFNTEWLQLIKEEVDFLDFKDKTKIPYGALLIILSIIQFFFSMITIIRGIYWGIAPLGLSAIIFTLGIVLCTRLNDKGYTERQRWKAFHKTMKSGNFHDGVSLYPLGDYFPHMISLGIPTYTLSKFREFALNNSFLLTNLWLMNYLAFDSFNKNNSFSYYGIHSLSSTPGVSSMGSSTGGGGGAGGGGVGGF
ncbi:DUF2207 domain-containing protein [Clostridium sp.]|uniref:DUF2207 domain-containing protein n=1 Tax=Clostridium sp. TaxID=1506 RepID=UPI002FC5A9AF